MKALQAIIFISLAMMETNSLLSGLLDCICARKKKRQEEFDRIQQVPMQRPVNINAMERSQKYLVSAQTFEIFDTTNQERLATKYSIDLSLCPATQSYKTTLATQGKFLGQGAFGAVYESENLAFKVIKEVEDKDTFQHGFQEFKFLKMFENYDKEKGKSLFQTDIQCKLDWDQNEGFLIIGQQLLGQNLEYNSKEKELGGRDFMNISQIRNDIDFRYHLYVNLFNQLSVYKEKNLVHKDIKPENVTSNINFLQIEKQLLRANDRAQKKAVLNQLKLMIIDYGLMTTEGDNTYSGTQFFFHPLQEIDADDSGKSSHKYDIFQLALTLAQIETYLFNEGNGYLFVNHHGCNLVNNLRNYLSQQPKGSKTNILIYQYIDYIMKDYRRRLIKNFCPATQVEGILSSLKQFKNNMNRTSTFYDQVCGDCYACVLASAFQHKPQYIPSVQNILEGFLIVLNKRLNERRIIQLKLKRFIQHLYKIFICDFNVCKQCLFKQVKKLTKLNKVIIYFDWSKQIFYRNILIILQSFLF